MRERLEQAKQSLAVLETMPQTAQVEGSIVYERGRIKHLENFLKK